MLSKNSLIEWDTYVYDLRSFSLLWGPGCRCNETRVLHPVNEFNLSPKRKDALVRAKYGPTCSSSPAMPLKKRCPPACLTISGRYRLVRPRHNLRNCQAPTCAHESGAVRSCVMVCACICQDAALAGQQCAFP